MSAPAVIGLDIGTTSTVALALGMPDQVLATAKRPVTLSSPHPGWAEEDPHEWWQNSCEVLQELSAALGDHPIAGICVTGMLPALVLIDRNGQVLRPSIQQSDGRCDAEVADLACEVEQSAFLARTGNGINQQLIAAKLRWIARHEPDVMAGIATVFGSYDYINFRLTGQRAVEQNWALEAGFTDIATHAIADDLVALAGIPRSAVPERNLPHALMGRLHAEAAGLTGLPEGLPVMGGAADHIVSALAAGITRAGDVLLKFGGAGDIVVAADALAPDPRLFLDYHLVPGLYAPNGCMAATGSALNWMARLLAPDADQSPHALLDREAAHVAAGAGGLTCLPYFLGEKTPLHDPLARGVLCGLSLDQSRGHIWRAMLEAVAYGFRHHLDVLDEIGNPPKRLFASDGGTVSAVWMQIVADVLQQPVQILDNAHGSSLGAAFVAAIGCGLAADWDEADRLAHAGPRMTPDPAKAATYGAGYRDYRQLYERLAPFFARR